MPRTDAAEYYWLVKVLRCYDWHARHEHLEHVALSMNPRHAGDMWGKVTRAMGPDELMWGTNTSEMPLAGCVIGLRDKTKKSPAVAGPGTPAVAGWVSYGLLSHSHLHQCLRNIRNGTSAVAGPGTPWWRQP